MKLKRFLFTLVLGLAAPTLSNLALAQSMIEPYQGHSARLSLIANQPVILSNVKKTLEGIFAHVIGNYGASLEAPLTPIILDSEDPPSLDFIKRVVRPYDKEQALSLHFEPQAYYKNEATALCLYPYNKTAVNYLLKSYEETGLINRREALLHVGFRAAGLCVLAQEQALNESLELSDYERQLFADSFALLLFALSAQEGVGARLLEHYSLSSTPSDYNRNAYLRELNEFINYSTMLFHTAPPQELITSVRDAFYFATNQPSKMTINQTVKD